MYSKLTKEELQLVRKLSTPNKVQDFLDSIPFNHEKGGETCMSPSRVITTKKAHCLEGAMFAFLCLSYHGYKPKLVNLKVSSPIDFDHVVVIYKEYGHFGAVSKTNHNILRFRDPVYKTIREVVMTYFHEYFLPETGEKTLIGYSPPITLWNFGTSWVSAKEDLWDIAETIYTMKHLSVTPSLPKQKRRYATDVERKASMIEEWSSRGKKLKL